jgi:hypothetical protein
VYFLYITLVAVEVDAQKGLFMVVIAPPAGVQAVPQVLGNPTAALPCVWLLPQHYLIFDCKLARRSMLLSNAMCSCAVADQGAQTDICTGATVKTAAQAQAQAQAQGI